MRAATPRTRLKATAAVATAVAMAVVLTACGGDDGKDKADSKAEQSPTVADKKNKAPATESDDSEVLATIKNGDGIELVVNSAKRDAGGFVTVKGSVKNGSKRNFTAPGWQGSERELLSNGASLAGSSLVDQAGKKRYLILRDTDGRCLCTKFVAGIAADTTATFFAQFPAPPQTTTEVDFQIPTMPTATIEISG
ncbi:hypothetical protein ACPXCE_05835 [Streptomyces sp. DT24]|uniref:hypothetical protein n=1 Tax=unclassified Streptomyces TaxID=2593676 RepID=UPI003CEF8CC6